MVFDVPAENGGALSILSEFYDEVKNYEDKTVHWIFVLSKPTFKETENIKIIRYPWVKKSWLHRFYFDQVVASKLVKRFNVDKIFSLQNIIVPRINVEQILYVHQPLPFIKHQFSFKENRLFWVYQKVISKTIYTSIKKAKKVIVQTNWLKKSCADRTGVNEKKITVVSPSIDIKIDEGFILNKDSSNTFFYPASGLIYKNHKVIIEACKLLKNEGIDTFKVIFTLKGNENKHISMCYEEVQKYGLPVEFVGNMTREDVFKFYKKSVLVFPSYIETFGLPLLEAKLHGSPIIASDSAFSIEILHDYSNAYFFDSSNLRQLGELMKQMIENKLPYSESNYIIEIPGVGQNSLINQIIDNI